jgi:hypothetical protein
MVRKIAMRILATLCLTASTLVACAAAEPARTEVPRAPVAPAPEAAPAASPAAPAASAEGRLAAGRAAYEQGRSGVAQQELQAALDQGLADVADRVTANKLLAFIACGMRQYDSCKGRFRRVLVLNPKFTLTPAELAHPIWGPLFEEIKAEGTARVPVRRETTKPAKQEVPPAR